MRNRLKTDRARNFVPATYRGPMPGDFPVGSIQSRAAARAVLIAYAEKQREEEETCLANLTPVERAHIQAVVKIVDEPPVRIWMIRLFHVGLETAKVYGKPLVSGTLEQIRHGRAVVKEIDRITAGEATSIRNRDGVKWNRLKAIAEQNLRAKEK